jgi:hypothetical protein
MKTETLRGTAVTARVGLALGVAIAVCFVTGLISHFIQHPQPWFFWPTRPVWLYRVTQGLHVISGIAAIPLIVVKLWSVWPKLFERPIIGGVVRQLERLSILVLVGSMLFQLSTGLMNIAQWANLSAKPGSSSGRRVARCCAGPGWRSHSPPWSRRGRRFRC